MGHRGSRQPPPGRRIPRHVALIMDGNARWARKRGRPVMEGHRQGVKTLLHVVRDARRLGLRYLTVYAFSTENWNRPRAEIQGLWLLLREFCYLTYARLKAEGIELRTIGDVGRLPGHLQTLLARCTENRPDRAALTLTLALSYGGRDEIVRAVRTLAQEGADLTRLTEAQLTAALDTAGLPDPDLIIRTAGERRLSNFLPWQRTYSEILFWPQEWPECGGVLRAVDWRGRVSQVIPAHVGTVPQARAKSPKLI